MIDRVWAYVGSLVALAYGGGMGWLFVDAVQHKSAGGAAFCAVMFAVGLVSWVALVAVAVDGGE